MREYHGLTVDAAVLLHERLERLTSLLSELESLRARVLEAERGVAITAGTAPSPPRAPSRHSPSQISAARSSV